MNVIIFLNNINKYDYVINKMSHSLKLILS
jgi:hypothetical protein